MSKNKHTFRLSIRINVIDHTPTYVIQYPTSLLVETHFFLHPFLPSPVPFFPSLLRIMNINNMKINIAELSLHTQERVGRVSIIHAAGTFDIDFIPPRYNNRSEGGE